jgi:phosphate transport system permease protein
MKLDQQKRGQNLFETLITVSIRIAGISTILFVTVIFIFLLKEGLPALTETPLSNLLSTRWYPIEKYFGLLPLLGGTLVVTLGAILIALPFGLGTAIYIAEVAPRWAREFLKPFIEVMAGIPSVVLGFIGMVVLAPRLRTLLDIPTGLSALAGALLLGLISIPTIVSVAEDALDAVPRSYRDASLAMGATRWQTIWRLPEVA